MWPFNKKQKISQLEKQSKTITYESKDFNIGYCIIELTKNDGSKFQTIKYGSVSQYINYGNDQSYDIYGNIRKLEEPFVHTVFEVDALTNSRIFLERCYDYSVYMDDPKNSKISIKAEIIKAEIISDIIEYIESFKVATVVNK